MLYLQINDLSEATPYNTASSLLKKYLSVSGAEESHFP